MTTKELEVEIVGSAAKIEKTLRNGKTRYQVLKLVEFNDPALGDPAAGWMEVGGPREAASAEALLRQAGEPGRWVAVPERSWKPVTVTIDTQTVVKIQAVVKIADA